MNHSRAQRLLSAYLERDLGEAERAAVEAHAAACEVCGSDLEDLRGTIALLRRLPAPEPPPYLAGRVMARICDGEARPSGWREWLGRFAAPAVAAPLAALAAAAVVVSLVQPTAPVDVPGGAPPVAGLVPPGAGGLPEAALGLPIVPTQAGKQPATLVAFVGPQGRQMAGRLRGAGHPHSQSLAAHFEGPAVAVSWQGR